MAPLLWANFGPLSRLIASAIKPKSPPLLILSLPRSGSSWVGSMIGGSRGALYLREPISQSYLLRHKRRGVVFVPDEHAIAAGYRDWADAAFAGLPVFSRSVVKFPSQWRLSGRPARHVVVKEVNPLAAPWLIERYKPRIIYLVRHPAAVAGSFFRLGWMNELPSEEGERRFSAARMGLHADAPSHPTPSLWSEHAALQGLIMARTLDVLQTGPAHRVVRYEDLCADPLGQFRQLYEFAQLPWDEGAAKSVEAHTSLEDHNRYESYSLYRNSRAMAAAWRRDVPAQEIPGMRDAFNRHCSAFYGPQDW